MRKDRPIFPGDPEYDAFIERDEEERAERERVEKERQEQAEAKKRFWNAVDDLLLFW